MIMQRRQAVTIKGVRDGLLITLSEGSWEELRPALLQTMEERLGFLKGARVALDVGDHLVHAAELGALRDQFSDWGITLYAVISRSPVTEQNAQALGLATRLSTPRSERTIRPLESHLQGENAILVQRTVRSGFKVSHHGHIVIIGDVNPGAEVLAGGNVLVWGKLKGSVHAGMDGNEQAVICALELEPTSLRIAGIPLVLPPRKGKPEPQMVRMEEGRAIVETWKSKK